ncbi:MAG: ABC transporter permease [Armatimonadetes bacterium]|nr:ABC transporter permease [Armatimonadota bacterium]
MSAPTTATTVAHAATAGRTRTRTQLVLRRMRRHPGVLIGGGLLLVIIAATLFAHVLAAYDPLDIDPENLSGPPSAKHPLGTDSLGRDLLSRVLYGGRISLLLGLISVAISLVAGVALGMAAGYFGGETDEVIGRFIDVLLAFPGLLLAMLTIFALGVGLTNAMIAVGISGIPLFQRATRAEVLSAKQNLYVEAARAIGAPEGIILWRHLLPNIIAPNVIVATLRVGTAIIFGASLSFLGLGAQAPAPEWGLMLAQGRTFLNVAWWLSFAPGLAIFLVVMATNLFGDGLRDVLDPRLRA